MKTRKLGCTELEFTTIGFGSWALGGGDWQFGWGDQDPERQTYLPDVKSKGVIAELIFSSQLDRSRYFFTALYNKIDSKLYRYETATLSATYLVARNLRLVAEYTHDIEHGLSRGAIGMVSGF